MGSNAREKIKCGCAQADITPKGKVQLMGQFYERITDEIRDPLMAVALCIEKNDKCIIWVSVDLCMLESEYIEAIGEKLKSIIPNFKGDDLIINTTHIHTGPYTSKHTASDVWGPLYVLDTPEGCVSPEEYMNEVFIPRVAHICIQAYESRKESGLAFSLGRTSIGHCRRLIYKDKSAIMYGESAREDFIGLESPSDDGVELLYISDLNGLLFGIIVNVACPAQVLEHKSYLSGDYWGDLRRIISQKFGRNIFILAQCAPAGDQSPRDLVRCGRQGPDMYEPEGSYEIAGRLADEIIRQYEKVKMNAAEDIEFSHEAIKLDLPIRKVTDRQYKESIANLEKIMSRYEDPKSMPESDKMAATLPWGVIQRYESQKAKDTYTALIHIVRLGDCVFATNPFELFINYGFRIKARSKARQTFTVQLTGDCGRYLPTKEAIEGGSYSTRISDGIVGPEGGEILVEKTLAAIEEILGDTTR